MLVLLSPAKSLDFDSALPTRKHTQPRLLAESQRLIEVMRGRSPAELAGLMHISDELAALNAQRYLDFETPFTPRNARPAVLAFAGDVYQGLAVRRLWAARDYTAAQKTVRILSGLYGVLRPLDLMQPYRLEMGLPITTDRGTNLYQFWGDRITELLRADLAESPGAEVVVNLASDEYARSVRFADFDRPVISPRFEDTNAAGRRSVVSFFAKRARGMLAGWLVRERARTPGAVTRFAEAGYRYDRARSTPQQPVFVRSYEDRPTVAV
ncbi:peroxide stress protein YaaA [Micropruina sp.]|uniref:peroxide stress protein YaaA n=1 Tax=Micropruina sp. TaxID=2737536 RepID=UPI0039E3AE08